MRDLQQSGFIKHVANELHTMSGNESQSLNCIYARLGVISEQLGVLIKRGS